MQLNAIYVYRSGGMGDVLWTEPIIRTLAARYKKVVLLTQFAELFANYPMPNVTVQKIPGGLKRATLKWRNFFLGGKLYHKHDGVYEAKPKMHMLYAYQDYFNLPRRNEYPALHLNENEKKNPPGIPADYAVIHLDSAGDLNYRKVYGVDWRIIADNLRSKGIAVVTVGNTRLEVPGTIEYKGSLRQLIQLINGCRFFIGVDSGPGHIAVSLRKPVLLFFGSVNPAFRHFREQLNGYILQQQCEFAGCYHGVISGKGQSCKLVGDNGIPKCSLHTTANVQHHIDLLMQQTLPNRPH